MVKQGLPFYMKAKHNGLVVNYVQQSVWRNNLWGEL